MASRDGWNLLNSNAAFLETHFVVQVILIMKLSVVLFLLSPSSSPLSQSHVLLNLRRCDALKTVFVSSRLFLFVSFIPLFFFQTL